jgi:hypothetical protein
VEVVETLEDVLLELVTLALEEICVDDIEVGRLVDEVEVKDDELTDTVVEDEKDEDRVGDMLTELWGSVLESTALEVSVLELEAFVLVLDSLLELELELDREVWSDEVGVVAKD